jgi:hypothetical protein
VVGSSPPSSAGHLVRKPTKCYYCPDPPMYLVTSDSTCHPTTTADRGSCGFKSRPVCLEHARGFVLSLTYEVTPLYDVAPRHAKKASK